MTPLEYQQLDALSLAAALRNGETTPFELMSIAVQLAQSRAEPLNAIVEPRYDQALEDARKSCLIGCFAGLPFLLKDSGLPSTRLPSSMGSRLFHDTRFDVDSTLVQRFEAAGLISFARTAVPELCMAPTTEAVANGGPTLNPWDPARSAGGSSGGSAVTVALGVVPMAHGSDGGGSIRGPASCCGVFGFKPSRGLLPMGPTRGEGWGGLSTDGVLTRTVRDTAAVLDAIKQPEPGAPYAGPASPISFLANLQRPFDRRLRIAKWADGWEGIDVDPECRAAVDTTESLLVAQGHTVVEISPPPLSFERFFTSFIDVIAANAVVSIDAQVKGKSVSEWSALVEPAILGAYQHGKGIAAADYITAINFFHQVSRVMAHHMRGFDLMLTPALSELPIKLGVLTMQEDFRTFRLKCARFAQFLAIINASGQPAASVPVHWTGKGVPVGIQLVGHFGDDNTVLSVSKQLEHAAPWFGRYAK
ncbi:amidase [Pseudomonas sp. LS1212]|uniref:amidase n=1 Tax=Pseudomonas sp. LS1212 TaxID=2972478 RepID=UPI00215C0FCA|nr:amidase [Pseudomonas sp. LS1212]UVJ46400.1 amidase [Pseudomonas sp. LS1212]